MNNLLITIVVVCILSCCSCYSPQIIDTSCAGYRSAEFNSGSVVEHGLAVMPIVGVSGKEQFRKPLEQKLYTSLCDRFDTTSIMSSHQATYLINASQSSVQYADAIDIYNSTGIIPREFINDVGRSIGKRYLLLSRVYYDAVNNPASMHEFTLNCQIWDTENSIVVWEGKGGAKTLKASSELVTISLEGLAGIIGHPSGTGNCAISNDQEDPATVTPDKMSGKAIGFIGATVGILLFFYLAST